MSAPVIPAAPMARAPNPSSGSAGGGESATPFATALDSVLGRGPAAVGGARSDTAGQGGDQPGSGDGSDAPSDPAAAAATGVPAAVWALVLAGSAPAGTPMSGDPATAATAATVSTAAASTGAAEAPVAAAAAAAVTASTQASETADATLPGVQIVLGSAGPSGAAAANAGGGAAPAGSPHPVQAAPVGTAAAGTAPPAGEPSGDGPADGSSLGAGTPGGGTAAAATAAAGTAATEVGDPVPTVVPGSPTPGTTATPGTIATTAPAAATGDGAASPVSDQLTRQVAVLRSAADGSHSMSLVLTPETLGKVEVHVTIKHGVLDVTLRGANELGRAALLDALPDLRRDLEAAGLSLSRLDVDRQTGGTRSDQSSGWQQPSGERGGRPGDGAPSRRWGQPADTQEARTTHPTNGSTSAGVDIRV